MIGDTGLTFQLRNLGKILLVNKKGHCDDLVLGQPGEEVSSLLILRVVADVGLVVSVDCALNTSGDEKHAHLKKLENAWEKLHLFKADLLDYNSLFAAFGGCDGVFHVASPVPLGTVPNLEGNFNNNVILLMLYVHFTNPLVGKLKSLGKGLGRNFLRHLRRIQETGWLPRS